MDRLGARRNAWSDVLDNPVLLFSLAGVGATLATLGTLVSLIVAAVGALLFFLAAGRWTWTMRDDFAFLLADADRPQDFDVGLPEPRHTDEPD